MELSHDAVIIVPGIMGSALRDARTKEALWSVETIAAFLCGRSPEKLAALHVADDEREGRTGRIEAHGLLKRPWWLPLLGGAEPYGDLVKVLKARLYDPSALLEFSYDWRLSVDHSARLLAAKVDQHLRAWRSHPAHERGRLEHPERRPAHVVLVAHSMGGLVCRALAHHRVMDDVRAVLTMGTPFSGSLDAAMAMNSGQLALFDKVPLNIPARAARELARTLPGLHDLLPTYRCLQTRDDVRALKPADIELIGGDGELARQAQELARRLSGITLPRHRLVAGIRQETPTSMTIDNGVMTPHNWGFRRSGGELILDKRKQPRQYPVGGDGRVYRFAAQLGGVDLVPVAQQHGRLPRSEWVLDQAVDLLIHENTGSDLAGRLGPAAAEGDEERGLGLSAPEAVVVGTFFDVRVTGFRDPQRLRARVESAGEGNHPMALERGNPDDGSWIMPAVLSRPGLYRILASEGGEPVSRLIYAAASG